MKLELNQKKLFAGERQFSFRDKTTLSVKIKTLKTSCEYLIDVVALDPKMKSNFIFAKKSLISCILFLNISLLFYLTPLLDLFELTNKSWYIAAATILSLISFITFLVFTQYERVFIARHTKIPLVRFYNGLPNKKEFKNFINMIQTKSQKRFEHLGLNMQSQCAGELKTIRRIQEQGGLSFSQYEHAKNKLLKFSDR